MAGSGGASGAGGLLRHQGVWVILAATFSMNLGLQYLSPLLPAIGATFHLSPLQIGSAVAAYAVPSFALTLPLGVAADLWGPRRLLIASLLVFGAAGMGVGTAGSFPQLLVWRVVQGIGAAPLAALSISTLADIVPASRQAMAQGYRSVMASGSEFVLPVLAGYLAAASGTWRLPLLLLAVPIGVGAWAAVGLPGRGSSAPRRRYPTEVAGAAREPAVVAVIGAGFTRWFLKYAFFSYLPLYLDGRLHASPSLIGYVVGAPGLAGALVATQAGRLGLAGRGKAALAASLLVFGAALPAVAFVGSLWWALGMACLFGASDGILGPLLNGFISVLPPRPVRVTVVSLSGLVRNVGKAVAPAVVGPLILPLGYAGAFAVAALAALTAPAYLVPLYRARPPSESPPTGAEAGGTGAS